MYQKIIGHGEGAIQSSIFRSINYENYHYLTAEEQIGSRALHNIPTTQDQNIKPIINVYGSSPIEICGSDNRKNYSDLFNI